MPYVRVHVYISGRVQGVFFRAGTKEKARESGINGWVRNCFDGSVEAVFEGPKEAVDKMIDWCHEGPLGAMVKDVEVQTENYTGEFDGFSIRY